MFFSPKTKTGLEFPIYKVSAFLQTSLDLVLEMFLNIFPNQTVFGLEIFANNLRIFFQTKLDLVWKRTHNEM